MLKKVSNLLVVAIGLSLFVRKKKIMIKKLICFAFSGVILLATSCASIVSRSSYPISINSSPSEAKIIITDKKGIEVYAGNTPATLKLRSGSGFFGKARYQVKFIKDGYDTKVVPVEFKLDGWYFGNLLLLSLSPIGLLIIDPATGAMYKLDTEFLNETLIKSTASIKNNKEELKVYSLNEVSEEWKNHLVKLGSNYN